MSSRHLIPNTRFVRSVSMDKPSANLQPHENYMEELAKCTIFLSLYGWTYIAYTTWKIVGNATNASHRFTRDQTMFVPLWVSYPILKCSDLNLRWETRLYLWAMATRVTCHINSSRSRAAYMHQWIGSELVQIMICRLFGAKSLYKPMMDYC